MSSAIAPKDLWITKGALAVPETQNVSTMATWANFGIWGVNIFDDQTPWRTLVECLHIIMHRNECGDDLFASMQSSPDGVIRHESVKYSIPNNLNLRHLLFRDQEISRLAEKVTIDPGNLWNDWANTVSEQFGNFDFSYLKVAFNDDFKSMAQTVELMRSAEIDPYNARRWTSRHLLPLAPSMLFSDAELKDTGFSLDRRFFVRTGEILYLMLCRSKDASRLSDVLSERLFGKPSPWASLAEKLQGDNGIDQVTVEKIGYLPMPSLDRYNLLAEDWLAILSQENIRTEDALEHIMRLSGLHEILYIIERGSQVAEKKQVSPILLDMMGTARKNPIQKRSSDQYKGHRHLPEMAIDALIRQFTESNSEWQALGDNAADRATAAKIVRQKFLWSKKGTETPNSYTTKETLLEEMKQATLTRNHGIGAAFASHARYIGLLTVRPGSGSWYSPSDGLLEAIVLANVREPMVLEKFLQVLKNRYHFVIGKEHAEIIWTDSSTPGEAFLQNERRLEERLRVLGFIDRKSDACAFVINPFNDTGIPGRKS